MGVISVDARNNGIIVDGINYYVKESYDSDGENIFTIEGFDGLEGRIGYEREDMECHNPRSWDNIGVMFCDYRNYKLGDDHAPDPRESTEIDCPDCEDGYESAYADNSDVCNTCNGDTVVERDIAKTIVAEYGASVIMPLYVYEHSGITMSVGSVIKQVVTQEDMKSAGRFVGDEAGWDTSTVGFIWNDPERSEGMSYDQIVAALRSEVNIYAAYLEGNVTWYSVDDDETNFMESCGGFVGDDDECKYQCFDALGRAIEKHVAEVSERAYWEAREVLTVT